MSILKHKPGRRLPLLAALLVAPCLAVSAQDMSDPAYGEDAMADDPPATRERTVQEVPDMLSGGLTVTPTEGDTYTVDFKPDGTFETTAGSSGGWTMQDGYLCLSDTAGELQCSVLDDVAEPGDRWTVTSPDGDMTTYSLPDASQDDTTTQDPDG